MEDGKWAMDNMKKLRGLFLLILVSIFLFLTDSSGYLRPVRGLFEKLTVPFQDGVYVSSSFLFNTGQSVFTTFQKDETIRRLESERLSLLSRLAEEENTRRENAALRQQLGVQSSQKGGKKLIVARIIGNGRNIILDKGSEDGVALGDIVVFENAALGKISLVSMHVSRAIPLSATSVGIPARTLSTNVAGTVISDTSGNIVFEKVATEENLTLGDFVLTRGNLNESAEGFPPDLILGKITSVDKKESDLFQKALLEKPINVSGQSHVFILPIQ